MHCKYLSAMIYNFMKPTRKCHHATTQDQQTLVPECIEMQISAFAIIAVSCLVLTLNMLEACTIKLMGHTVKIHFLTEILWKIIWVKLTALRIWHHRRETCEFQRNWFLILNWDPIVRCSWFNFWVSYWIIVCQYFISISYYKVHIRSLFSDRHFKRSTPSLKVNMFHNLWHLKPLCSVWI